MRGTNSGIWNRRQHLERAVLEPILRAVDGDADAEPMFSERLCLVIRQYWRIRGATVLAWVERVPMPQGQNGAIWCVRTSGIPVRP